MTTLQQTEQPTTLPYDKLKILIVADNASARFGGESILPLHYFDHLLSRNLDVHLLVHDRCRDELTECFPDHQHLITYIPDTSLHRILYNTGKHLPKRIHDFTFSMLTNLLTQRMQKRIAKRLVKKHNINIVHQPMPVSPRQPSMIHSLGAPVIIGPMNGNMSYPSAFKQQNKNVQHFINIARRFSYLTNILVPGKRRASLLLVSNQRTHDALPVPKTQHVIHLHENAVNPDHWPPINWNNRPPTDTLNLICLGRLVPFKNLQAAIHAIDQLPSNIQAHLHIIGNGPERPALQSLTEKLNLNNKVTFHGFVPQHQCHTLMQNADALLLPSIYECGGAVVLEAMCMALPTIVANWGGPTDYVTPDTGFLLPVTSQQDLISALTDAITKLYNEPHLKEQLGLAGRQRILDHFLWPHKIDQILHFYLQHANLSQQSVTASP
ncbi:glycosyltransferase family 4 protein [Planctomycetota bacterium]|nr:glycosyltransferase family 4 protein [Planctomycetota bacterium]